MVNAILHVFEVLKAHASLCWASLLVLTAVLALLLSGQTYKEDISDFLPLDSEQQQALQEYQSDLGAQRIYAIIVAPDSTRQAAMERLCEEIDRADTAMVADYMTSDNPEVMQTAIRSIYARMPWLLTEADYARIESLTADADFVSRQLENDRQALMLPTAGMMAMYVQHDPLGLFTPVVERLRAAMNGQQTMLLIDSPYGPSETEHNAQLVDMLQQGCDNVKRAYPDVDIHLTGGPVIAVGNAQQIRTDSIAACAVAVTLIMLLLWLEFRDLRNLLLIAFSTAWGWLFAMGCLTLVHHEVSIIVIGISSVVLGIAVNYPLHLVAHLPYAADTRSALREVAAPLVVGNITTVGTFLTLVPLESVALRDLGLFGAFLLVGTMLFVLLWLPHLAKRIKRATPGVLGRIGHLELESKTWVVWTVAVMTLVLGYFSMQTSFDADLRNINYMTAEQKADMQFLQTSNLKSPTSNQQWNQWREGKGRELCQQLKDAAVQAGFAEDAFDDFYALVNSEPADEGQTLTTTIVNSLTDNFNYIGWACGVMVFCFLWCSLGSIELALLAFLPMAVSWVWILGIMSLLGIQFNVVNIILATFIFGQGDDYTIFMTEGCQYEYAYRRKMLDSYKHSIIISALIMFIGIGALIFAKHPALHSLALVTIIGMFSVVLMAYLFPPLIFRWLVYSHGKERWQPLTIRNILGRRKATPTRLVSDAYRYRGIDIATAVNRRLKRYRKKGWLQAIDEQIMPSTKTLVFINSGWGEVVLYFALRRPDMTFVAIERDGEKTVVARNVAESRIARISFYDDGSTYASLAANGTDDTQAVLLEPSDIDIENYQHLNPIMIK